MVETSVVGTILNGLSHLNAVTERGQFIVGLLRGLGGNVNFKTRQEFAKEVRFPPVFVWAFNGCKEFDGRIKLFFVLCHKNKSLFE